MCNHYTTGFNFGQLGCGYGYNAYGCWNGGWGRQTICRDACGNIVVNQGRNNCCPCHQLCNGNGNNGNGGVAQNGNTQTNGRFTCVTFCGGNNGATTTTNGGDLYYARQYGLYPYGYNRGCGCTLDAVNET